jgi:A/G-specific adenine glycosylase
VQTRSFALPAVEAPPAAALLTWYDRHRRDLPWRAAPGAPAPDPYRIWLSEVMLQQTTAAAVGPRYRRFLDRFPTIEDLAAAPDAAVMEEWAGLGYYARARNLHACARAVAAGGHGFPREAPSLRALPGIGAYTAAAIAAIAFEQPIVPVDANVERVVARLFAVERPLPAARPELAERAQRFMRQPAARGRPGDFAQALFDLGATICTPTAPACAICPWHAACAGRAAGLERELPRKPPRPTRPIRHGVHFLLSDAECQVLLRRRPPHGLLGGMLEIPGTPWRESPWLPEEAMAHAPAAADWRAVAGTARHGFTHFEVRMRLLAATVPALSPAPGQEWRSLSEAPSLLPTAMRRLLDLVGRQ